MGGHHGTSRMGRARARLRPVRRPPVHLFTDEFEMRFGHGVDYAPERREKSRRVLHGVQTRDVEEARRVTIRFGTRREDGRVGPERDDAGGNAERRELRGEKAEPAVTRAAREKAKRVFIRSRR